MFYEGFTGFARHRGENNSFVFNLPMKADAKLYSIEVSDIGEAAATVFSNPDKYKNRILSIAGEYIPVSQITALLQKTFPEWTITYSDKPWTYQFPGSDDLTAMFEYFGTGKMHRDLELTRELNPNTISLSDWLAKNRDYVISKAQ
jgi:hypothetical protein